MRAPTLTELKEFFSDITWPGGPRWGCALLIILVTFVLVVLYCNLEDESGIRNTKETVTHVQQDRDQD